MHDLYFDVLNVKKILKNTYVYWTVHHLDS